MNKYAIFPLKSIFTISFRILTCTRVSNPLFGSFFFFQRKNCHFPGFPNHSPIIHITQVPVHVKNKDRSITWTVPLSIISIASSQSLPLHHTICGGGGDSHTSMFCCNITVLQCRSFQHSLHRFQGPSYSNIARIMNAANVFVFVIVFVIVPQL